MDERRNADCESPTTCAQYRTPAEGSCRHRHSLQNGDVGQVQFHRCRHTSTRQVCCCEARVKQIENVAARLRTLVSGRALRPDDLVTAATMRATFADVRSAMNALGAQARRKYALRLAPVDSFASLSEARDCARGLCCRVMHALAREYVVARLAVHLWREAPPGGEVPRYFDDVDAIADFALRRGALARAKNVSTILDAYLQHRLHVHRYQERLGRAFEDATFDDMDCAFERTLRARYGATLRVEHEVAFFQQHVPRLSRRQSREGTRLTGLG